MIALKWDWKQILCQHSKWNQHVQTKKKSNSCKLKSKWYKDTPWASLFTRHERAATNPPFVPTLGKVRPSLDFRVYLVGGPCKVAKFFWSLSFQQVSAQCCAHSSHFAEFFFPFSFIRFLGREFLQARILPSCASHLHMNTDNHLCNWREFWAIYCFVPNVVDSSLP
jgi:hypothetical protein